MRAKWTKKMRPVLAALLAVTSLASALAYTATVLSADDGKTIPAGSEADAMVYHFDFLSTPSDGTVYDKPITAGWTAPSGANQTTAVENSDWIVDVEANSFTVQSEENTAIEAALYPSFRMNLRNGSAAKTATLYYTTSRDSAFDEKKSATLEIQPKDPVYREYLFDMSGAADWAGMIHQVRVVFHNAPGDGTSDGQVRFDYFSFNPDTVPANLIFDFSKSTDAAADFINADNTGSSLLRLAPKGAGAGFDTCGALGLDAAQFNYVKISLQNNTSATKMRVWFKTRTSRNWSEDKSVPLDALKTSDSGQSLYAFNMTSCPLWRGTVEQLRITFENTKAGDGHISIPIMGVFTDTLLDDEVFAFTNGISGWTAGTNAVLSHADGAMKVEVRGADASFTSPELSISADELRYIKLNLKNDTASTGMRVQWMKEGDAGFSDLQSQNILLAPRFGMREYVFPIGDHQRWKGTVTRIKITPALYAAKGSQQIKSIAFSQNEDVSFLNRTVTEGRIESGSVNGWTKNQNGGQVAGLDDKGGIFGPTTAGVGGAVELVNNGPDNTMNKGLPTEAWRSVPMYTDGMIKWPVSININNTASAGNRLKLMDTKSGKDIIRLTFDGGEAKADLPGGSHKIADIVQDTTLRFTLYMDMAAHTYDLWLGTALVAEDLPFTNAGSFDKIYAGTSGESKVIMSYTGAMYRVNELYEDFSHFPTGAVTGNVYETGGTVKVGSNDGGLDMAIPRAFQASRVLSMSGNSYFKSAFQPASNVVETNISFAVMTKADGIKMQVTGESGTAAVVKVSGSDLVYQDGADWKVLWKDFKPGVHYTLKMRVYLELNKVELSVNGSSSKNGGRENVNTPAAIALPGGLGGLNGVEVYSDGAGLLYVNSIRVLDYTPSTVPTVEAVNNPNGGYVGVNGWVANHSSENFYQKSQRIADKESVLGYFDDFNKEALDWQIKFMAENGIDFISYFYIGFTELAVDTYIDYADYKNMVNFAYALDYYVANSADDFEKVIYPILSERLFRNPNYIKYQNKPILFAYSNEIAHWTKETAQKLKALAIADGFDGLHLVNIVNSDDPQTAFTDSLAKGYDYVTQYWKITTPQKVDQYYEAAKKAGIDYIASPGVGADSRCWGYIEQTPSPYPFIHVTPADFYHTLTRSKEVMRRYSPDSLASKMVFTENWSELGEGHSIIPFGEFGFGYINQIRRVFSSAKDNNHRNARPSGKYDLLFSKGWDSEQLLNRGFESGVGYWQGAGATVGAKQSKEFYYMKGAAEVSSRATASGHLYQDVTGQLLRNGPGAVYNMSAYVMANSQTYKAPDDTVRYMSFFPTDNKNLALTHQIKDGRDFLTVAAYDAGAVSQKFVVRKGPLDGYYQIYLADGYQTDADGKVTGGKQIVTVDDWPNETERTQFLKASVYIWNVNNVNSDNVNCTYFRFPADIYDEDTIAIRGGINHQERTVLINEGAGKSVALVIDWSGAMQRWVAKYREPTEIPKAYRTPSSLVLEITDTSGTHSYTYEGGATLFGTIINAAQFKVSWTGELKQALFKVCGDAATKETFLADECRLQLVASQQYEKQAYTLVGGKQIIDRGPDPGNEDEALIIEDIIANENGNIVINLSKPVILSRDVFRAARQYNVSLTINLVDGARVWYSWSFQAKDIDNPDIDLNTRISYTTPHKASIDKRAGSSDNFYLSFAHQGPLPGKATIKAYVGEKYDPKDTVWMYSYDANSKKITKMSKMEIDQDGYVTFTISKPSEYLLNDPNPRTGTETRGMLWLLIAVPSGVASLILFRRRRTR